MNTTLPLPEVQEISFVELLAFCLQHKPHFIDRLFKARKELKLAISQVDSLSI